MPIEFIIDVTFLAYDVEVSHPNQVSSVCILTYICGTPINHSFILSPLRPGLICAA